jgi:hypothetical protein
MTCKAKFNGTENIPEIRGTMERRIQSFGFS